LTGLIAASQAFAELLRKAEPELASHMVHRRFEVICMAIRTAAHGP